MKITPIGFGSYRIDEKNPLHEEALRLALIGEQPSRCNLIDTSTNYTNGRSEKLIGKVLNDLFTSHKLKRDGVTLVTKVGYVQGDNLLLAKKRIQEGRGFPEMVEYSEGCWHCISPDFLEDQITRSLDRLQISQIDVLLLHNPEYYLKLDPNPSEYYRRIKNAFDHLEQEVKRGRIQSYGVSSNTLIVPNDHPEFTSLESLIEIAGNHFAFIQFPFNLFESGAAIEQNNSGLTVCELAATKNIVTLTNRPFNAFTKNEWFRLTSVPHHADRDLDLEMREAFNQLIALEAHNPFSEKKNAASKLGFGHMLRENLRYLPPAHGFREAIENEIEPSIQSALQEVMGDPWAHQYKDTSSRLLNVLIAKQESEEEKIVSKISNLLDESCPKLKTSLTLSQKVLRVYLSIPGIHCVLVGMRRPHYVADTLNLQEILTPEEAFDVLDAICRQNLLNKVL